MHLPTLRQLEFLCAVAEQGSFSKAAETCHVTQPTLSAAIKEIEGLLGVQLIEREARGASLTRAGEAAVERARSILSDSADLVSAARQAGAPLSGPFRLGAIPTIAPFLLPRTLKALRKAHPNLKLYLREDQTERLLEALRTRKLDAALIALPWEASGIETLELFDDEFLLVAPTGHSLLRGAKLASNDLADEDVLLLEDGHCLRDHALSVCRLPARRGGADVTATSLPTLVHMVAGGLGVSLLPKLAIDAGVTSGADVELRAFQTPMIGRRIGIAWRTGSPRANEAQMIGEVVRAAL
ncbi:MAG: hydrogen peroxide-inducible genes activator [Pseudomonadota bacterium]|nr:hydrogen peroxide-inducible genes activator [Pseudomonadota bacterium]